MLDQNKICKSAMANYHVQSSVLTLNGQSVQKYLLAKAASDIIQILEQYKGYIIYVCVHMHEHAYVYVFVDDHLAFDNLSGNNMILPFLTAIP